MDKPGGCWYTHKGVTPVSLAAPKGKAKARAKAEAGNPAHNQGSKRQQSIDNRAAEVVNQLIKDKGIKGVKKRDSASVAAATRAASAGNVAINASP